MAPEFAQLLENKDMEMQQGQGPSVYNVPQMKTFYQKKDPVAPYATTTLINAAGGGPGGHSLQDHMFRPITQHSQQSGSGDSGCCKHECSGDSNTSHSNTGENYKSRSNSHTVKLVKSNTCIICFTILSNIDFHFHMTIFNVFGTVHFLFQYMFVWFHSIFYNAIISMSSLPFVVDLIAHIMSLSARHSEHSPMCFVLLFRYLLGVYTLAVVLKRERMRESIFCAICS